MFIISGLLLAACGGDDSASDASVVAMAGDPCEPDDDSACGAELQCASVDGEHVCAARGSEGTACVEWNACSRGYCALGRCSASGQFAIAPCAVSNIDFDGSTAGFEPTQCAMVVAYDESTLDHDVLIALSEGEPSIDDPTPGTLVLKIGINSNQVSGTYPLSGDDSLARFIADDGTAGTLGLAQVTVEPNPGRFFGATEPSIDLTLDLSASVMLTNGNVGALIGKLRVGNAVGGPGPGGDGGSDSDGGSDAGTTTGPAVPVGFASFIGDDGLLDEEGRFFYDWRPRGNGYGDFDPGPIHLEARNNLRLLACLVRGEERELDCYTTAQLAPDVDIATEPAPTDRTRTVARAASTWSGVTSVFISVLPAGDFDYHLICAATNEGIQCAEAGLPTDTMHSAAWVPSIAQTPVKALLRGGSSGFGILRENGKLATCAPTSPGSTTGECVDWEGIPDVELEWVNFSVQKDRGMGITTTGEIAQWGITGDEPPAGPYRKLVQGTGFTCGIKTTDEVVCWDLDSAAMTGLEGIIGKKVRDLKSASSNLLVINEDGLLETWPGGTIMDLPRFPTALDSCAKMDRSVCSEIIEYETAMKPDYYSLCEAENSIAMPGACKARRSASEIVYTCLGQDFEIMGKTLNGMAYFYRGGPSCDQAIQACENATGNQLLSDFQWCHDR